MNVGDPVVATDDEGDILTYTLDRHRHDDSFDIDRATGQIMVGAGTMLDFEADQLYLHGHRHGHRPRAWRC